MNEEIKKYTETFHNTYEMLAPKYGYETRGDTKQLDFDSPNGKLMYATIEKIVCPILEENQQLKEEFDRVFAVYQSRKLIKKFNDEYDEEDKTKNPNRDYACICPDAEEVYKRYYELKEQLQQKEDIINKAIKKCNKEKGRTDFDIFINLNEQLKTLEGFAKKIDYNLHPIITEAYKCEVRNCINELCEVVKYKLIYKDELLDLLKEIK